MPTASLWAIAGQLEAVAPLQGLHGAVTGVIGSALGARSEMAAPNGAVAGPEAVAAKLLDFSQPLDVVLLDSTVNAFYGAGSNQEVRSPAT